MKNLLGLALLSLLILSSCGEISNEKKEEASSEKTDLAETQAVKKSYTSKFPIYDFEGLEPMLNKTDDKTYVVNFWATWCKPCVEEMPHFERINAEQKENNVEVILVSLDMPNMWRSRLEPFVEKKGIQSTVVILDDPKQNEWIPKVAPEWGGGIPATLIYNKDKRNFYERGFTYEELNIELNKFIN
ncbi:redoxin domain-containing protein [Muricauda sp. JGD-17]|uniref:Redoxin domain-containing protein n=1 Tax=Flagellimonas ochracea TaxID=2696472 RepID=A0A964TCU7_9FLAO|nr:TlpA disulfide reductase family protein [Allomuricauda ochracea]NAY92539.1 redoxin domain-containing protein [Allomuricauda ochracea]